MENVKKCKKKCKKMQKLLHISKKSSTFVADLGIVPATTNKYNGVMKKKNSLNALGEKERRLVLTIGRKRVVVYEVVKGLGKGMGIVQCSLYPDLGGIFPNSERALDRANKIRKFHERQLEIMFVEEGKEE